MNRKVVIHVPDWNAAMMRELLAVPPDAITVMPNDYMIETIGKPFLDENGRRVVEITLAKSADPTWAVIRERARWNRRPAGPAQKRGGWSQGVKVHPCALRMAAW